MTKIISGLEQLKNGNNRRRPQQIWFWRHWVSVVNNAKIVFVSPIFKNGVTIHKFKLEHLSETDEIFGHVACRICVTANDNLAYDDMPLERNIIDFVRQGATPQYDAIFRQTQVEFDILRRYEGANLMLAIGFHNSCQDGCWVSAGLLYSEP